MAATLTRPVSAPYAVDTRLSRFTVQAFAGGLLSALAQDPIFAIRGVESEICADPGDLEASSVCMEIRADSLQLLGKASEKDTREIEWVMREKVLEVSKFPVITFEALAVEPSLLGPGQYRLRLEGRLALHGITQRVKIPARVAVDGDTLRAFGEFTLNQTDYGIKPVTLAGGVVKVKDELKFSFELVAKREN